MVVMVLLENKFNLKQLFCRHKKTKTITNFYGDMIIHQSRDEKEIIRSLRICKKCHKLIKSNEIDDECKVVNFDLIYDNGNWRSNK